MQEASSAYELYGLVEHHGSLNGGHYVAYSTDAGSVGGGGGEAADEEADSARHRQAKSAS